MLIFSVFIAGMTTLAAELAASRLLGNVFGTSNLVWANIIGFILLYLTAGYFIGGRWADRSPHYRTFYQLLCWAAMSVALVPLMATPILKLAAQGVAAFNTPVAGGSFVAALAIFIVPITLLGCVSPFAVRLASHDLSGLGGSAGRIYAVSTLGSLVGTFLPVLVTVPLIGTARTYILFAALLLAVAMIGLWQTDKRAALKLMWMPFALVALYFIVAQSPIKAPPDGWTLRYETESAYNFIQVVERTDAQGTTRYLLLNEGQGLHSVYHTGQLVTGGTWDFFLSAPFFNPAPHAVGNVQSLALVGLAAGTIAKQYTAVYGAIPIDGIEIDPAIAQAGRDYFDMTESNLNVIVQDGRWALTQSKSTYSVIGVDAYRLPYIPPHLTTYEFFQEARRHLANDGVLVINVGRTPHDRRLIEAMSSTLRAVFPSVYVIDVPDTFNSILVATVLPTTAANLSHNLDALPAEVHPLLRSTLQRTLDNLQPTVYGDLVFTDDVAPVEQLTNSIVINFVLGEGLSFLK